MPAQLWSLQANDLCFYYVSLHMILHFLQKHFDVPKSNISNLSSWPSTEERHACHALFHCPCNWDSGSIQAYLNMTPTNVNNSAICQLVFKVEMIGIDTVMFPLSHLIINLHIFYIVSKVLELIRIGLCVVITDVPIAKQCLTIETQINIKKNVFNRYSKMCLIGKQIWTYN